MNYEPGSYRDRNGRVFYAGGAVYRGLSPRALRDWEQLAATRFFRQACQDGRIVATEQVAAASTIEGVPSGEWAGVLKHQRIPFVSYPYEWSFGMLKDAAILQLELLAAALDEDFLLKDGSAYNLQWLGSRPVFIDVPSFERMNPGEPWVGYRQFCQTLLFPLFLQAYKNTSFHPWLRGCLEGIEPGQCKNLMSWRDVFRRGVLTHVFLHANLQTKYAATERNVKADLRSAGFGKALIQANVRGLLKTVRGLNWKQAKSVWSDYATNNTYTDTDQERKEQFVRAVVSERRRGLVWDIGCNTGNYSRIAAENSDYVVAMDSDHLAVERLYQSLKATKHESILPLVCNLADASPNLGWRGLERKSLVDRGRPDLTLCLALIHHVVIGANIPMTEFIEWLAGLGTDLVIEFVTKDDPMVKTLLRNKRDDYADYSIENFERCLGESFRIARREPISSGTRTLYHAVAKSRTAA
jgi:ribosomal protein L11 methylase PrmA